MGSTAHATKYYPLSRCFVKTNIPNPSRVFAKSSEVSEVSSSLTSSSASEFESSLDATMKSEYSSANGYSTYSIPSRYLSRNYRPDRSTIAEYSPEPISCGHYPSYSSYLKNKYASSRYVSSDYESTSATSDVSKSVKSESSTRIKIPVTVKVTVTAVDDKRQHLKSEYQNYQESLKSYKVSDVQKTRVQANKYQVRSKTPDFLSTRIKMIGSTAKENETAMLKSLADQKLKIKITDLETYNRLLTPVWRRNRKEENEEVSNYDNYDSLANKNDYYEIEKTSNAGFKLARSASLSLCKKSSSRYERSVTPEPQAIVDVTPEVRETESYSRPMYYRPRYSDDAHVQWPGRTCTAKELTNIITEPSRGNYVIPFDAFNEVYPGLYIGDMHTALCTKQLRELGITHVLNAAQKDSRPGQQAPGYYVNTSPHYYSRFDIDYLGVPATDVINFDLSQYFEESAEFIDNALATGGKVLVHCHQGISRSATLVLAFLMLKRGMSAQDAMRTVRSKREVIPNASFLRQLCELNDKLTSCRRRYQDMHRRY